MYWNTAKDQLKHLQNPSITHLEEPEDQPLVHLRKYRKSLLIGQENTGGENGCFDGLSKPTINDMIRWEVSPNFKSYTREKKDLSTITMQEAFSCPIVQDVYSLEARHPEVQKTGKLPSSQSSLYETPNSYSQEVREGIPILGPLWTYRLQSSCYSHIRSGSCATCPEQIQKNIVTYIWPNNHHSLKRPHYRFHPVLPLTLSLALVQQQKETYHIHVFSSPLYSSVCVVGAFSIISSLRSSGATKGTRIQNCTRTSTPFRTQWIQKASFTLKFLIQISS